MKTRPDFPIHFLKIYSRPTPLKHPPVAAGQLCTVLLTKPLQLPALWQ
jgi:hypothetical protein